MKTIFSALTLALALTSVTTAHASDRKIGNVIAVERTIDDVYQSCVEQMKDANDDLVFASCKFDAKKSNADFSQGNQRVLTLWKDGCEVEGSVMNGVVLVTFQATGANATLKDSKACLRKAIDGNQTKDSFKFIIYTVE
jgi:hypothetical protein